MSESMHVTREMWLKYFRLDEDPLIISSRHGYSIGLDEAEIEVSEEDIDAFLSHLVYCSDGTIDVWWNLFMDEFVDVSYQIRKDHSSVFFDDFINYLSDQTAHGSVKKIDYDGLKLIWGMTFYKSAEDLNLSSFSGKLLVRIVKAIERMAKSEEIVESYRKLYVSILDHFYEVRSYKGLQCCADAYYGGNELVPCDWKKAEEAYVMLDQMGNRFAADPLGYIYYSKRLGEPNYEKAFYYFSKSYRSGNREAIYKLSDMYRKGHGTAKNPMKALELLKTAYQSEREIDQMHHEPSKLADVALRMGYCVDDGLLGKPSPERACTYYLEAKRAIRKRRSRWDFFGDSVVERNIDLALEHCLQKIDLSDHIHHRFAEDVRKMEMIQRIKVIPEIVQKTAILEICFYHGRQYPLIIPSYQYSAYVDMARFRLHGVSIKKEISIGHIHSVSVRHRTIRILSEDRPLYQIKYETVEDLLPDEPNSF